MGGWVDGRRERTGLQGLEESDPFSRGALAVVKAKEEEGKADGSRRLGRLQARQDDFKEPTLVFGEQGRRNVFKHSQEEIEAVLFLGGSGWAGGWVGRRWFE